MVMPVPEPKSETQGPRVENPKVMLAEWLDCLNRLVDEVKVWVEKTGWRTRLIQKSMSDEILGPHKVPVLLMERDTVEVALNPVSRFVPGADGAVDLYLVPAYDDIASLYFESGRWVIYDDLEAETEGLPLSEETINQALESMTAHA